MSWAFVGASAVSTGSNPTITLPTNAAGDLMLIGGASNGGAFSAISGWTEVERNSSSQALSFWWRVSSGSESSVAITSSGATTVVAAVVYSGVNDYDTKSAIAAGTGVTSISTNSLTTAGADELVISLFASNATATRTWTAPGSTTERVRYNPDGTIRGLLFVDENKATAGATTSRTATTDGSANLNAFSVAFKYTAAAASAPNALFFGGGV